MKKFLLSVLSFAFVAAAALAQCVPDGSITTPGIYPDTTTNLPHGTAGVFYSSDIQVRVLTDTSSGGVNVSVTDITIDNVVGLPSGFSFTCAPSNCAFPGGGNGCIRLFGTNNTPGTYNLTVNVTLHGLAFGVFPVSQAAVIEGYRVILDAPPAPLASFSASTASVCEDDVVSFTDMSSNSPTSWSWVFPGGTPSASSSQNPVVTYATPGTYDVTLTVSNLGGSDMVTLAGYISVNEKPLAKITPTGTVRFCPGEGTTLSANPGPGYTYQWYKYGNLLVGETNQMLTISTAGDYKVKVTDPATGCTKRSGIRTVELFPVPSIQVVATGPTTFCKDGSVNLAANTAPSNTIQWTKGGVDIPGANSNVYQATLSGFYRARATSLQGCSSHSTGISVSVMPSPNAGISASGPLEICQGGNVMLSAVMPSGSNTYQWEQNLIPIPGETGTSYLATSAGKYTYTVEGSNGCSRRSPVRKVSIVCREAAQDRVSTNSVSIQPNPARDFARLELMVAQNSNIGIDVFDITGNLVQRITSKTMEAGSYTIDLELNDFVPGIYFVRSVIGNQSITSKLVIQ